MALRDARETSIVMGVRSFSAPLPKSLTPCLTFPHTLDSMMSRMVMVLDVSRRPWSIQSCSLERFNSFMGALSRLRFWPNFGMRLWKGVWPAARTTPAHQRARQRLVLVTVATYRNSRHDCDCTAATAISSTPTPPPRGHEIGPRRTVSTGKQLNCTQPGGTRQHQLGKHARVPRTHPQYILCMFRRAQVSQPNTTARVKRHTSLEAGDRLAAARTLTLVTLACCLAQARPNAAADALAIPPCTRVVVQRVERKNACGVWDGGWRHPLGECTSVLLNLELVRGVLGRHRQRRQLRTSPCGYPRSNAHRMLRTEETDEHGGRLTQKRTRDWGVGGGLTANSATTSPRKPTTAVRRKLWKAHQANPQQPTQTRRGDRGNH
jgi:hypothetical protein